VVAHNGPGSVAQPARALEEQDGQQPKTWKEDLAFAWGRLGREALEASMAQGYRAMAELNLALAREDEAALADWPQFVGKAEADPRGDS